MSDEKLDRLISAMASMQSESVREREEMRAEMERRSEEASLTQQMMQLLEERIRTLSAEKGGNLIEEKAENADSSSESAEFEQPSHDLVPAVERSMTRSTYKPCRPPLFAGEVSPMRPRLWRGFKIQMKGYLNEIALLGEVLTETRKVELYVQNLASPAVIIASNIQSRLISKGPLEMVSLDKFEKKLDKLYLRKNVATLYDELFQIEQAVGEPTESYYERFTTLLNELLDGAEIPKDVAVGWFSNGLLDTLKDKLVYRRSADSILDEYADNQPEEAVERCFEIAAAEEATLISSGRAFLLRRKKSESSTSTAGSGTPIRSLNGAHSSAWRMSTDRQASSTSFGRPPSNMRSNPSREEDKRKGTSGTGPRCYSCQERGHIARECTKKKSLNNIFASLAGNETDEEVETAENQSKK